MSKIDGSIQKAADRIIALEKQLSASTAALKIAKDALNVIARPALGGKSQQFYAQATLVELDALASRTL